MQHALHSTAFYVVVPPFQSSKHFSKSITKSKVLLYLSGKQFALRIFSLTSLTTSSTYCNVLKYKLNKIIFKSTGNQCISFLITILFLSFERLADKTMSQGHFYILQLTILITDILREETGYRSYGLQKKQQLKKKQTKKHQETPVKTSAFWLQFVPRVCEQTEVKQQPEPKARSVQAPSGAR